MRKPDVEVINVGALLRSVGSGELYIYLGEATEEDFVRHNIRRMRTHKNYSNDYLIYHCKDNKFIFMEQSAIENYFQWLA